MVHTNLNSLPDSVKSKCVMYADDTTLLTSSSDPLTLETDLKRSLDMVANDWFNSNQLTLNIKKTKLMMFGTWQALKTIAIMTSQTQNFLIF